MTASEPADVGPAAGGNLPITDTERARVWDQLRDAREAGTLDAAEWEHREIALRRSRVRDDLTELTRDLPTPQTSPLPVVQPHPEGRAEQLVAVFSSITRDGVRRQQRQTNALTIFGEGVIDLTQATFDAPHVYIDAHVVLGEIKILVPAGIHVIDETMGILGETSLKGLDPQPGGPTVTIRGFSMLGEISVRGPQHKSVAKMLRKRGLS